LNLFEILKEIEEESCFTQSIGLHHFDEYAKENSMINVLLHNSEIQNFNLTHKEIQDLKSCDFQENSYYQLKDINELNDLNLHKIFLKLYQNKTSILFLLKNHYEFNSIEDMDIKETLYNDMPEILRISHSFILEDKGIFSVFKSRSIARNKYNIQTSLRERFPEDNIIFTSNKIYSPKFLSTIISTLLEEGNTVYIDNVGSSETSNKIAALIFNDLLNKDCHNSFYSNEDRKKLSKFSNNLHFIKSRDELTRVGKEEFLIVYDLLSFLEEYSLNKIPTAKYIAFYEKGFMRYLPELVKKVMKKTATYLIKDATMKNITVTNAKKKDQFKLVYKKNKFLSKTLYLNKELSSYKTKKKI